MNWPQYTYLVLSLIGIGICIAEHGTPKTGRNNAFSSLIAGCIVYFLLIQGGFFSQGVTQ